MNCMTDRKDLGSDRVHWDTAVVKSMSKGGWLKTVPTMKQTCISIVVVRGDRELLVEKVCSWSGVGVSCIV